MWKDVIKVLRSRNQVGNGFPFLYNQLPEYEYDIADPKDLAVGYTLPCGKSLKYISR